METELTIEPTYELRLGDRSTECGYVIVGAATELIAKAALEAAAPDTFNGLRRDDFQVELVPGEAGHYEGTCRYTERSTTSEPPDLDSRVQSFDVAAPQQTLLRSLGTVSSHAGPGVAIADIPDFHQHVGVDADNRVNGVAWPPPGQIISETAVIRASRVNPLYYRTISGLAGRTNNQPFLGFNVGELIFLGVAGTRRSARDAGSPWDLTYRFSVSLDAANIPVAPGMVVPFKRGWDYLWTYSAEEPDAESNAKWMLPRVIAAYVERMAYEGDFSVILGDLEGV